MKTEPGAAAPARHPFALALGGNLGDVEATLRLALRRLRAVLGPLDAAPLYRSAALAAEPQPDYLNTAAVGCTALPPEAVLAVAKRLEMLAGRRRGRRHGPRPLDVDLLFYGTRVSRRPELALPHPRLAARRFVLAPLADLIPGRRLPPHGHTVRRLLAAAPPHPAVRRLDELSPL